jgi:DNA-directed RNA polymerase specialized sigma24 family protein
MNKLTPRTRETMELKALRGFSTKEAARVLGLSVAVVKGRLFHGRRKLEKVLRTQIGSQQLNSERKRLRYGLERKEK